jgi:hypothetical protein
MLGQESNREKRVLRTQQNSLEVEIIDLIRLNQPEAQSIFITAHVVPELYNVAKERRKASLILIDNGVRYSLRSVHISKIETDGSGRMTCYYVNESPSSTDDRAY